MIFEISWRWYEDYNSTILEHDAKTQEQFVADCEVAIRAVGEEVIKVHEARENFIGAPEWIEEAVNELVRMGYKKINPIEYSFWGCYLCPTMNEKLEEDDIAWRSIVGDKLFEKARIVNTQLKLKFDD